jgi:PAS domain S-box-containing protein
MPTKILVADDSGTDRLIIRNMLVGYDVLLACDGVEALRAIEDNPDIDLMILDLNMPNMDGFQVLDILRSDKRYERLLTIILTNYDELVNEIKGLQMGAVDYIRKPIHMESLKARIETHVELLKMRQLLEDKLSESEITFDTVFQEAPIGIAISQSNEPYAAEESSFVNLNKAFEQITGRTKEELNNIGWAQITHPDDADTDLNNFLKLRAGELKSYSIEKRLIKPDGSIIWVYVVVARLSLSKQRKYGYICLIQDITTRKEIERALTESERSKSVLLSNLQGMAYRCNYDREWTMQFVSSGCFELTGYMPENLLYNRDLSFNDLITPEYREPLWNEWKRIISERMPFKYEYEIMTAKRTRKWVLEIGQGIYDDQGEVEALEGIIIDISDRKEMENNLRYINEHDRWTGLYNRDFLGRVLLKDLKEPNLTKRALIGVNLSTVSLLTANYGFQYTQNLIKKAAETLNQYCTDEQMLFNTFENQFVFYLKNYKNKNELNHFSEIIAGALESLFVTDRVGGGIGILEIEKDDELDVDRLLKRLLIASERSINIFDKDFRVHFYDEDLEAFVIREGEIRQELGRIAADNTGGELFLQYQPILDLKSNSVCGFEALARLRTEKLGLVPPVEFIPIAEKTKLIIPIGEKVIIDAFRFSNKLTRSGYKSINISVNVSAIQLLRPEFTTRLLELINEMHVDPENIGIEFTESLFAGNYDDINNIINKLKGTGIHIAIDDFGTGYSSLAREKELSVDCLKIDKYFIDKLLKTGPDKSITGDIISMAHRLGHCTIAEGVEQEEQKQYLLAHGCDKIQGYLVGRPLDEEVAMELLSNQAGFDDHAI